jgi:two-component system sensor histidine kinase KdpD
MAPQGSGRMRHADILVGALASAGAVALVTAVIGIVDRWIPVLSLGALYVFAVLFVAVVWGLAFALPVAIVSMLAFNWFFLPPTHTLHLREGENWLVLVLYLVVAVVASELAARARRRAREAARREREAALLAEVAASLLGRAVTEELDGIASRAATVLGVPQATITLGEAPVASPDTVAVPLVANGSALGVITMPAPGAVDDRVARRFLAALASLLAVALDREQLQREALEADTLRHSDAVKTTVLRAVSHDLRSPLTAIAAAAGGLASSELELDAADRAELAETILTECGRLERMVADLLDLSRLEAGAVVPAREIWALDELVGAALDELRDEGTTVVDVPDDLPPVEVDAGQARRILVNLLENAKRHAASATGVRVVATASGAGTIALRVGDDGPGIDAADAEHVFEPFWRGARGGGRTGLGLAIARGFAEANGGSLRVEPTELGTRMVLTLPAAAARPVEARR